MVFTESTEGDFTAPAFDQDLFWCFRFFFSFNINNKFLYYTFTFVRWLCVFVSVLVMLPLFL